MSANTCEDVGGLLDDFVDGLLDGEDAVAVERHLEGCVACREEARALRALVEAAAALPTDVAPPHDLWPAIAHRIERGSGLWMRTLAAAAALLLALGAGLASRTPAPPATSTSATDVTMDGTGRMQQTALQTAEIAQLEAEYTRAAEGLLAQLRARQGTLSPRTVVQVEASLQTIDGALADIRTALQQKPSEPTLHLMLASTHRKKIDLLRRVMRMGA